MDARQRRVVAEHLVRECAGVVSRDRLAEMGLTHVDVRTELRAGRWRQHGRQMVALHNGDLDTEARRWRAVWEVGSRGAAIDGVSALQAAGLTGYTEDEVHVSVSHTARVGAPDGVRVHKVIRRLPGELRTAGLARTRPPVATLRAAYWAASDRQVALILLMAVRQRLVTPARPDLPRRVAAAHRRVPRPGRRRTGRSAAVGRVGA